MVPGRCVSPTPRPQTRGYKLHGKVFTCLKPCLAAVCLRAGALEHTLARTAACVASPAEDAAAGVGGAAPPPACLPLPRAFCLRLPDADRLAVHNELGRVGLALERCLAECRVPATTAPHDALALQEYFAAGMWVHDRYGAGTRVSCGEGLRTNMVPAGAGTRAHVLFALSLKRGCLCTRAGYAVPGCNPTGCATPWRGARC